MGISPLDYYEDRFESAVNNIKKEGRYRVFADLERKVCFKLQSFFFFLIALIFVSFSHFEPVPGSPNPSVDNFRWRHSTDKMEAKLK